MAFVRTFVGRKAHIPINAISTILSGKSGHIGIEHRNFLNNLVYQLMETRLVLQELFLMSIEPFAVIVALQLTEICDDCFHIFLLKCKRHNKNKGFLSNNYLLTYFYLNIVKFVF